jgi:enterochelin esterase family protein
MSPVPGTPYWLRLERLEPGRLHSYRYLVDGDWSAPADIAGYTELSYELPDVPRGTLSEGRTVSSRIYSGAVTRYWLYANHGIDEARGAPVMVWHDGQRRVGDLFAYRMQIVTDNLVFRGSIPPMVHVLVSASVDRDGASLRGLQYGTVSSRYGRLLVEELLPDASRAVKLRSDGYSRGSAGTSAGGSCAFKLAWFEPNEFSRAQSAVGALVGYAPLVRGGPHRNIRVWLCGGRNDHERETSSNPLNNLDLANALKLNGYDFHLSFGEGHHHPAQAALDLPRSLAWLWRDYDPDRTQQVFEQEPSERTQPPFRVSVANRAAT